MKHFTIENETNNIVVHRSAKEAEAVPNSERFSSDATFSKLAAAWPMARFVDIWNSLPGETPVKKFKDRATAVSRIWKAIQNLGQADDGPDTHAPEQLVAEATLTPAEPLVVESTQPEPEGAATLEPVARTNVGAQAPDVAPAEPKTTKNATRAKKTDTTQTGAPCEGTKASQVIAMLRRPEGTTVEEIMTTMKWLKHTTRAMLSAGGSITKNHGLTVTSEKVGETRRYYIRG